MGSSIRMKLANWLIGKALKPYTGILGWTGGGVYWATNNKEQYVKEGFLKNAGVYSVVTLIADTAAAAPFAVYRVKNKKKASKYKALMGRGATPDSVKLALAIKEQAFELDDNHPLNELIDKPNPYQSGQSFTANSIGFRLLTGERFLLLAVLDMGANEGKPFSVMNLPPQYMNIIGDGTLFGIKEYQLTIGGTAGKKIPADSVIFNKKWNPDFGAAGEQLRGVSPLSAAWYNVNRLQSSVERSVSMIQNQGAAGMVFNKDVDGLTEEAAGALKFKFNSEVLGKGNAGKIAVANGDFGYLNFGYNMADLSVIELEKLSLEQVCNAYHVPPGLFMPDNQTDNNSENFRKQVITAACIPELNALREDWNNIAKLYKGDDIYVDYDLSVYPELQEDMGKLATTLNTAWWLTPNEKRLKMGEDEDMDNEMMNKYLVPSGLTLIDDLNTDMLDDAINGEIATVGSRSTSDNNQREGQGL